MTIPRERMQAVRQTREFLFRLCNPKETPRVPSAIRDQARRCIKHYPTEYDMERAAEKAWEIFDEPK